jgi:hypothetical protein
MRSKWRIFAISAKQEPRLSAYGRIEKGVASSGALWQSFECAMGKCFREQMRPMNERPVD